MLKKNTRSLIITLTLIVALFAEGLLFAKESAAYDHTQGFIEWHGTGSLYNARSPLRTDQFGTYDSYSNVNSNNNQPRTINGSSDLHNATDLRASAGTKIFPITGGYIVDYAPPSSTSNNGWVTMQYYINGGYYFVRYFHVVPANLPKNTWIGENTVIGEIDIKKTWDPHLDIGEKSSFPTGHSIKLYKFYRHVSQWDYGAYLEWFSGDVHSGGNMFYVNCVTANTTGQTPCSSVAIHYKIGSSGTWTSASMSPISSGANRWQYNFGSTGATSGQTVYYYLSGRRSDTTYNWGYFPQYYKYPDGPALSTTYANAIARTYTMP